MKLSDYFLMPSVRRMAVIFPGAVKDRLPLPHRHLAAGQGADKLPAFHVHHLPKVMLLALRNEMLIELKMMYGHNLRYHKKVVDLMSVVF